MTPIGPVAENSFPFAENNPCKCAVIQIFLFDPIQFPVAIRCITIFPLYGNPTTSQFALAECRDTTHERVANKTENVCKRVATTTRNTHTSGPKEGAMKKQQSS